MRAETPRVRCALFAVPLLLGALASGPLAAAPAAWTHPRGAFTLEVPEGWKAEVVGEGVDLSTDAPEALDVFASLRVGPRGEQVSARGLAETSLGRIVSQATPADPVRSVVSHAEGSTADKRHKRSVVGCLVSTKGRVLREDWHFIVGQARRHVLWLQAPKETWERWLPTFRALAASLVVQDDPLEDATAETLHDAQGRFDVALPSGWQSVVDPDGSRRMALLHEAGRVSVGAFPRPAALTTAEVLATDIATRKIEPDKAKGAKIELLRRGKAKGGGAGIDSASVLYLVRHADGRVERHEVHGFVGQATMTVMVMVAPDALWALWLPSFRQVWSSLRVADEPLAGADGPDTRVRAPEAPPAPTPTAPPAAPPPMPPASPPVPEPPTTPPPPAIPLTLYEDPAGLFRIALPAGWNVSSEPLSVSAASPGGNALASLTLGVREGEDHAAFLERVLARMPRSFAGWQEQGRAVGGGEGVSTTRVEGHARVDGTPIQILADLSSWPRFHQLLLLVCPLAQREGFAPTWDALLEAYGSVTGAWPGERPLLRLREASLARAPYHVEVPTNWGVEPSGLDLVARAPHGDALVVARASARAHESIDALGQAVLSGLRARNRELTVLGQEVVEREGRPLLTLRVRDVAPGGPWEREVLLAQRPTHDLTLVLSCRADLCFKWAALLARVRSAWQPR